MEIDKYSHSLVVTDGVKEKDAIMYADERIPTGRVGAMLL
jgi:hypothetical protein